MHKKIPKICTGCRVNEAKIYLYHSTEIAIKLGYIVKNGKQTLLSRRSGPWPSPILKDVLRKCPNPDR